MVNAYKQSGNSVMNQLEIIPEIKRLLLLRKYDAAIALADEIEMPEISIKARLLCIESEKLWHENKTDTQGL